MNNNGISESGPGYGLLSSLFDQGSFAELGAYIKRKGYKNEYEGVVCGYGAINGRLVFAFSQDSTRMRGAVDEIHAKKIEALYDMAMKNGSPIIGIFDSDGGMIKEGISSVSAYGKIIRCISDASGRIPQIAILKGICNGSMTAAFQMFDIKIAVKDNARLYVGSPFIIGQNYGKTEFLLKKGLVSLESSNEMSAYDMARRLIDMLPDNCNGIVRSSENDDLQRLNEYDENNIYLTISSLADKECFIELNKEFGSDIITGLAVMGGLTVGIVANRSAEGVISADSAGKTAAFIGFCDSFGIPIVTLANSRGAELSSNAEECRIESALARLAMAYTSTTNAKVTVITGNLYGSACVFMGTKALGTDVVYALPDSVIGALSPEASVAFMENDLVGVSGSREDLEEKWRSENLSAKAAAEAGEVDDLIDPSAMRQRICSALFMLTEKNQELKRRHIVNPL